MRKLLILGLLINIITLEAQVEIEKEPVTYVEANNYGGKEEFKRFLQQEMYYPKSELELKSQGTVEIAAIIDHKTGKPSEIHVKTSISTELDEEAIRLYKKMLFEPSLYYGKGVTKYGIIKFKFSPSLYKKYCKKRGYTDVGLNDEYSEKSFKIYSDNQLKTKPKLVLKKPKSNLSSFIQSNLKYPEGTLRLSITGAVKLFFVVEPTGRITNIKVLSDVGGGATAETIRLLKLTKWLPGEKDGKKVRTSKEFVINYNLTNDSGLDYVPTSY